MKTENKNISISDRIISYSVSGNGAPIVLLHPVGLDRTSWREFCEDWPGDNKFIAIDTRGHGGSSKIEGDIEFNDFAEDVLAVIEAEGHRKVNVIGVSMGGMVAQHLALLHPECVKSLILCSTAASFPEDVRGMILDRGNIDISDGMKAFVELTIERWFSPDGKFSKIAKECVERLLANDAPSWAASWGAISRLNTLVDLESLKIPTLVVTGESDVITPPLAAQTIFNAIDGAELAIIPDAYHLGIFEIRESFITCFSKFLNRIPVES